MLEMSHVNMTNDQIEAEVVKLTQQWYEYVNTDHHKDRDCHFFVEKVFSYGEPAHYRAWHEGYVADSWNSDKFTTARDATLSLLDFLQKEKAKAVELAKGAAESGEDWDVSPQRILEIFND